MSQVRPTGRMIEKFEVVVEQGGFGFFDKAKSGGNKVDTLNENVSELKALVKQLVESNKPAAPPKETPPPNNAETPKPNPDAPATETPKETPKPTAEALDIATDTYEKIMDRDVSKVKPKPSATAEAPEEVKPQADPEISDETYNAIINKKVEKPKPATEGTAASGETANAGTGATAKVSEEDEDISDAVESRILGNKIATSGKKP